jgi:mannose/fructose/N-acetylgalactosamine-specific phosphotransferase system component IIC
MMSIWMALAVGSIISLDIHVFFQSAISQPLISATLIGWLCGDIMLGVQLGMLFQLLWISSLPVGAVIPPEINQSVIAATLLAGYIKPERMDLFTAFLIILVILGSFIGARFLYFSRLINVKIFERLIAGREEQIEKQTSRAIWYGLILQFVFSYILLMVLYFPGSFLWQSIEKFIPPRLDILFSYFEIAVLASGCGFVFFLYKRKHKQIILASALLLGLLLLIKV